jgi:hypothetical protein
MGAQLVGRAIAFAAVNELKPNEFRLLVFMSLTALDTGQPPRYFAKREASAYGIGRVVADLADGLTEQQHAARDAAFQAVKVATQGLVRSGAIERLQRGRQGHRAEFALRFRGTKSLPLESREFLPLQSTESLPTGVGRAYPQGTTEEPQEELPRRTPRFTEASHLQPVDNDEQERRSA